MKIEKIGKLVGNLHDKTEHKSCKTSINPRNNV